MTVAGRAGLRGRGQDLAFTGREVGAPVSSGQSAVGRGQT